MEIFGEISHDIEICIYDVVLLSKCENFGPAVHFGYGYHPIKVMSIDNIAGYVESEILSHTDGLLHLPPVFRVVTLEDLQVSVIGFSHTRIDSAHLSRIAFLSTFAVSRTSYDGRQGHGRDISHFAVAWADTHFIIHIVDLL